MGSHQPLHCKGPLFDSGCQYNQYHRCMSNLRDSRLHNQMYHHSGCCHCYHLISCRLLHKCRFHRSLICTRPRGPPRRGRMSRQFPDTYMLLILCCPHSHSKTSSYLCQLIHDTCSNTNHMTCQNLETLTGMPVGHSQGWCHRSIEGRKRVQSLYPNNRGFD